MPIRSITSTMFQKRALLLVGAAAAVFGAASVGLAHLQVQAQAEEPPKATAITLNMSEYAFQVDGQTAGTPLTLKIDTPYTLLIKNIGALGHEIWFGKDPKQQEGRVDGYTNNLFTGVDMAVTVPNTKSTTPLEVDTTAFYEVYLNAGEAVQLAFTLPPNTVGTWELGCFQLLPTAQTATQSTTPDMAMTMPATASAATAAAGDDAPPPSHYTVGMKLPLIVQ